MRNGKRVNVVVPILNDSGETIVTNKQKGKLGKINTPNSKIRIENLADAGLVVYQSYGVDIFINPRH